MVIRVTFTFPDARLTSFLRDFQHFAKTERLRAEGVGAASVTAVTIAATPEAFTAWIIPLALDHGTVFS